MYKVEYSKEIEKDLSKLPKEDASRILSKLAGLSKDPRPPRAIALQGSLNGLYRIRSGNYRIVYSIFDHKLLVMIVRVAHRNRVYDF